MSRRSCSPLPVTSLGASGTAQRMAEAIAAAAREDGALAIWVRYTPCAPHAETLARVDPRKRLYVSVRQTCAPKQRKAERGAALAPGVEEAAS